MAIKNLLHASKFHDFNKFLMDKDYFPVISPPRSMWERQRYKHRKTNEIVIIFDNSKGVHLTIQDKDGKLIHEFLKGNHAKK
jgi:hypothetical protein